MATDTRERQLLCKRQLDLGIAHHRARRRDEARRCYEDVVRRDPSHADAWHLLGVLDSEVQNHASALVHYDRSLALQPDHVRALKNRGLALSGLKRIDEALASFDRALSLKPDYVNALNSRGNVLQDVNRLDEAVAAYDRALAHKPDNAEILNNRGVALKRLKRLDEALASFDSALVLQPDYADALNNRGNVLQELNRLEDSLASYDRALALRPNHSDALKNRGVALTGLKRLDEALASFNRALMLKPDYANAYNSRGMLRLLRGEYQEGWVDHEWRWQTSSFPGRRPEIAAPQWQGEDIAGRKILVFAEQGLGDIIQFSRYLALLVQLEARVTFLCPPKLVRLLKTINAPIEFVTSIETGRSFDYQSALMSLPLKFNTEIGSIPCEVLYLKPEADLDARWKRRIGAMHFKIGIAWQGKPNASIDRGRSFPVSELAALSRLPGVRLISLQKNDGLEQLNHLPAGMTVDTLGDEFDSGTDAFIDTAAVMRNLDLVVTSDTSIAHLAGALGCQTWVGLQYVPDWRWLLDRNDSPWYPTLRVFRQETDGDWKPVFATMARELQVLLGNLNAESVR